MASIYDDLKNLDAEDMAVEDIHNELDTFCDRISSVDDKVRGIAQEIESFINDAEDWLSENAIDKLKEFVSDLEAASSDLC